MTSGDNGKRAIWISWEDHRRSRTLASRFGIPLYVFSASWPRYIKHPFFLLRTIYILLLCRPDILFVQNPSILLTLFAIILKPLLRYHLVVDAHNAGVYPFEQRQEKFAALFPFIHRHTDITIVTNAKLASIIKSNGGRPFVLPDPLPKLKRTDSEIKKQSKFVVTFVCSYAADEPYLEVFKAARELPEDIQLYCTGNYNKLKKEDRLFAGDHVIFTGFLTEKEYVEQLTSSDCIIVLTTFDDCMVCGAYEAVSLGIPLILSDTPVLRSWFNKGVVYSENRWDALIAAISQLRNGYVGFIQDIGLLKSELSLEWDNLFIEFYDLLTDKWKR